MFTSTILTTRHQPELIIRFSGFEAQRWSVFALRLGIGGLFIAAGLLKVGSPNLLAETIAAFRILPQPLVAPLAIGLPYLEIMLGAYLVIGLFTQIVGVVVLAQLLVFAAAIASVVIRGISTSCGCFGPEDTQPATWFDVGRDLVLAVLTLPIIAWGPGPLAVDYYLQAKEH